ncbi:hypothetical protein MLD38_034892 [Melastoma candidum]|uniref:Uncharacterized protein n=1 Tax=Melastoma candidum TaxID=119954 RepID=A0ACB9MBD2_9MYRT|nr:hypothetical protein MLD38_034892 [Melastoma candidum]
MAETEHPPSSPASSPPHELSFEPSFVPRQDKSRAPDEPFTVDLSPADDIFFHGHLLPLRLLSHLPSSVPPRDSSTSFTLPSADDCLAFDNHRIQVPSPTKSAAISQSGIRAGIDDEPGARRKHKSNKPFSLFGLQRRKAAGWDEVAEHEKRGKRKIRFDARQVWQALKTITKSFSLVRSRADDDIIRYGSDWRKSNEYRHRWGHITAKGNWGQEVTRRGRYASAPPSIRASPANSGVLVADIPSPKAANDSTIEELQAAIQAAILHCKNSMSKEGMKLTT